jgi:multiple sugar transport system substrate-binding protein/raffinose/stachyose/melibiose transport system substrate-binding protein
VPAAFYSDIQQRVRREIDSSLYFAFNYDLATPPAVAQLGLNAFSEFLAFPGEYSEIQMQLAVDAKRSFAEITTH